MNKFDKIALITVSVLAVTAAVGLRYLRPNLFHIQHTLPATLTYFGLFAYLLRYLLLSGKRKERRKVADRDLEVEGVSQGSIFASEIFLTFFLLFISTLIGATSGSVWWGFGGYQYRTLLEAIRVGAILGAAMVIFLAAGP